MRTPWRSMIGLVLVVAPAVGIASWPAPAPRAAPMPMQSMDSMNHMDHGTLGAQTGAQPGETAIPAGVGAAAWDGKLPAWPAGGRVLEVSRDGPYTDVGAALAAAGDGDRVIVSGGTYRGHFTITHRIWLQGQHDPMLDGGGEGTVVKVTAPGARVTGFMIHNTGNSLDMEDAGVWLQGAKGAVVAGNHMVEVEFGVDAKNCPDILVAGNTVIGRTQDIGLTGDGIRAFFSKGARIIANTVKRTREIIIEQTDGAAAQANVVTDGVVGIHFMQSPRGSAVGNFLGGNSNGFYVMYGTGARITGNWVQNNHGPSGYGVGLKEASDARVESNWFIGNRVGIYFDDSPLDPTQAGITTGNLVFGNDVGALLTPATTGNRISGNDFVDNLQQVSLAGGGTGAQNLWTVDGRGNYWSDYNGYDADGDKAGDVPYAPVEVFEGWMDHQPALRWFWFTPASAAVDMSARAFPLGGTDPILVDDRPATAPAQRRELPWLSYGK